MESDLDSELELKSRERTWIERAGNELLARLAQDDEDEAARTAVRSAANDVNNSWRQVKALRDRRTAQMTEARLTSKRLTQDLSSLRDWMREVEPKLGRPILILDTSEKEYKKKRREYLELQKVVSKESTHANEVFNNCDLFLSSSSSSGDSSPSHGHAASAGSSPSACFSADAEHLRAVFTGLQRRWKAICARSTDKQDQLEALWNDWCKFNKEYGRIQKYIEERTQHVQELLQNEQELSTLESDLESVRSDQRARLPELDALNDFYCELAREYRLDASDDLKTKFIRVNDNWERLAAEVDGALRKIRNGRQMRDAFEARRDAEMIWLRQTDARLTELEYSTAPTMSATEKRSRLEAIYAEMADRAERLDLVASTAARLTSGSRSEDAVVPATDADQVHELAREMADLRSDMEDRFHRLEDKLRLEEAETARSSSMAFTSEGEEDEDAHRMMSAGVQVETLRFERDVGVQSNTLTQSVISGASAGADSGFSPSWASPSSATAPSHIGAAGATSLRATTPGSDLLLLTEDEDDGLLNRSVTPMSTSDMERLVGELRDDSRLREFLTSGDLDDEAVVEGQLEAVLGEMNADVAKLEEAAKSESTTLHDLCYLLAAGRSTCDLLTHLQSKRGHAHGHEDDLDLRLKEARDRLAGVEAEVAHKYKERAESENRQRHRQLEHDLWRLEKWLEHAEGSLQDARKRRLDTMESLEDAIHQHSEFLSKLDSHRSVLASVSAALRNPRSASASSARSSPVRPDWAERMRRRLADITAAWEDTCQRAHVWQNKLQEALLQNGEFHETIEDLSRWLDETTSTIRASEPVDLGSERAVLAAKHDTFTQLLAELQRTEPKIVSLQEAAESIGHDRDESGDRAQSAEAASKVDKQRRSVRRKLSQLSQKLRILMNVCAVYSERLARVMEAQDRASAEGIDIVVSGADDRDEDQPMPSVMPTLSEELRDLSRRGTPDPSPCRSTPSTASRHPSDIALPQYRADMSGDLDLDLQDDDEDELGVGTAGETTVLHRCRRFLGRVARAAVPIQGMMLLLLAVSSFLPLEEDELICSVQNTFQRSFEPMLRWNHGPPPI